jgi:hypothetical protein
MKKRERLDLNAFVSTASPEQLNNFLTSILSALSARIDADLKRNEQQDIADLESPSRYVN